MHIPSTSKHDLQRAERASARYAAGPKLNLVRILFVHCSGEKVQRYSHELERVRFTVSSEVVETSEQFAERLRSRCFDIILAEYPNPSWPEAQMLERLGQLKEDTPLILLVHGLKPESAAEFILHGAADCIEVEHIGHLPIAVHRALKEKALRDQRDRAEKRLRHSETRYRALAGNLNYGICRCSVDGRFLEVNEAMISMLGYGSKDELLALDIACNPFQDPNRPAQLVGRTGADALVAPSSLNGSGRTKRH